MSIIKQTSNKMPKKPKSLSDKKIVYKESSKNQILTKKGRQDNPRFLTEDQPEEDTILKDIVDPDILDGGLLEDDINPFGDKYEE